MCVSVCGGASLSDYFSFPRPVAASSSLVYHNLALSRTLFMSSSDEYSGFPAARAASIFTSCGLKSYYVNILHLSKSVFSLKLRKEILRE